MININELKHKVNKIFGITNKALIVLILMLISIIFTDINRVEARLGDNVPEYRDLDYDYQMFFRTISNARGQYTMKCTADVRAMDELSVPNVLLVKRCCSNPSFDRTNFFRVAVNGVNVYYNDNLVIQDDITDGSTEQPPINFKPFRTSNANIDVEYRVYDLYCHSCGQTASTCVFYNGLFFTDKRGKASFQKTSYQVNQGGSVTITPEYNSEAHHMSWGIRKKGDSGFTLLKEGKNGDGIIAANVNGKSLTLSNVPALGVYEVGVFVYDSDGSLPAGTSFPVTPYYVSLEAIVDSEMPRLEIKKTYDKENGQVIVKLIGSDNSGLHETPYSWDGGKNFSGIDTKAFTETGTYQVALRDASGNVTLGSFYIDSMDIEMVRPSSINTNKPIQEKETGTDKGGSEASTNTGSSPSANTDNKSPTQIIDSIKPQTGGLNEKTNDKEYVLVRPIDQAVSDKTTASIKDSTTQSDKKSKSDDSSKLKPTDIDKKDSDDMFEKIRQNSEDYIISMKETKTDDKKMAADKEAEIDLKTIDTEGEGVDLSNSNGETKEYTPENRLKSNAFLILIIVLAIILILLLLFFLFFGVIIFAEKETEFTALSGSDGIKMPVALSLVSIKDGQWSVCFRELLEKYGIVYARFGLLFVYLYENDRIKIMTKFKGEAKREIATEKIKKEIIVGSKGGSKK